MDIKKTINSMDEYSIQKQTKGRWFELVLANTLAIVFVMLGFNFPFLSLTLAFIVMAYLQIGVYGFALKTYQAKNPKFEEIFFPFKHFLKVITLKIVVMAGMAIWALALIVPGIIFGLNYAFAGFVLFENPEMEIKQVLSISKKLTYGKRIEILLMTLSLITLICAAASLGVGIHFLLMLAFKVPVWLTIMLILIPAALVGLLICLPLFEFFLAGSYENSKELNEKSPIPSKKSTSSARKPKKVLKS